MLHDSASCHLMVLQGRSPVYNFYFACTSIESTTTWFPSGKNFKISRTVCNQNQISLAHLILLNLSTLTFWRICHFHLTILEWNQTIFKKSHAETFLCSIYHRSTFTAKFGLFWFSVNKSRNSVFIMAINTYGWVHTEVSLVVTYRGSMKSINLNCKLI